MSVHSYFVEELSKQLKEEEIEVDETKIEDAFNDLLFEMPWILPLEECIKQYLKWKDCLIFSKLDNAMAALVYLCARFDVPSQSIIERHKLDTLNTHLSLSTIMFVRGAIPLALSGNASSSSMLLRSALEGGLKGLLYQHLLNQEFRAKLKNRHVPALDPVKNFLLKAEDKARSLRISLEDVLEDDRLLSEIYKSAWPRLTFRLIARQLEEWKVFHPLSGVTEMFVTWWKDWSDIGHGYMTAIAVADTSARLKLDEFLGEIVAFIDLMLGGTLNTMRFLTHKSSIKELMKGQELADFMKCVKGAGLKYMEEMLGSS